MPSWIRAPPESFRPIGSIGGTERTTQHGKVKAIDEDQTTIDLAITAHYAIAGHTLVLHAKVGAVMLYIFVHLNESALVEENIYSFTNVKFLMFHNFYHALRLSDTSTCSAITESFSAQRTSATVQASDTEMFDCIFMASMVSTMSPGWSC